MSSEVSQLSVEERIKALLFQYLKLYERWAEDRQAFNKNMAVHEEMLKDFSEKINEFEKQTNHFEQLEPQVRQALADSVKKAATAMVDNINTHVGQSVTSFVDKTTQELNYKMKEFYGLLKNYQSEMQTSQIKTILITIGTAIASSLLIAWLLIPKPYMPLSSQDMNTYLQGVNMQNLWPKLSRKTQLEIDETAKRHFEVAQPFGALTSDENEGEGQQ
jgi:hypothetical protein